MTKKKEKEVNNKEESFEESTNKRTDYVLAIFLIFLGTVLLLNTTGLVEWNVWSVLWRFWPLLIVFAGLSLIFENSKISSLVIAFLALITLGLAFLWSADLIESPRWFGQVVEVGSDIESTKIVSSDEFPEIEKKNIDIDMAVGVLDVTNEVFDDHLRLDSEYFQNLGKPSLNAEEDSGILEVSLELGKGQGPFFWGTRTAPRYSIVLGSEEIPTDLSLNLGAGQGNLQLHRYNLRNLDIEVGAGDTQSELSDISLKELNLDVGAGNLNLQLSEDVEIEKDINVKVGVGKLTIILPKEAEYKLKADVGIGSVKTKDDTFSGFGSDTIELKTENYDSADVTFKIVADVGVGQLVIK